MFAILFKEIRAFLNPFRTITSTKHDPSRCHTAQPRWLILEAQQL